MGHTNHGRSTARPGLQEETMDHWKHYQQFDPPAPWESAIILTLAGVAVAIGSAAIIGI